MSKGEKHGSAKLTEEKVREIRRLYEKGVSQVKLGRMFDVDRSLIGFIVRRELWRDVV